MNAGVPYEVITFGFSDDRGRTQGGLPEVATLVLIRSEDEPMIRDAEQSGRELICLLDPAEPESQIGAFTFMGRVSGFRNLNDGRLAAEFTSVGPVVPHFMRG